MSNSDKIADQQRQLEELLGVDETKSAPTPAQSESPAAEAPAEAEAEATIPEVPDSLVTEAPEPAFAEEPSRKAWDRVLLARHAERPHAVDYIERMFDSFDPIHGDRCYGDDCSIAAGFASFRGAPVMVIGQEKGRDTKGRMAHNFGMPKPEGYRKALRAMRLAAKFKRPILTLLDTPGAYPGIDAEERGQAEAIARSLYDMAELEVPVVAVCIGEGGSGGALALGVGNRVLMLENAVYSVISPESCAAIVWRDASKAELAAEALKLTAPDLLRLGLVDEIVAEPEQGAHSDWDTAAELLGDAVERNFLELGKLSGRQLVDDRYGKFRRMGAFFEE
ncbi:MAG: acetyl-CoA carboxylase carboxyltransferase subunit alpha [Bryobacterales bacterium]|nr:acetyl-CoA carboxylase carboxyltransferase subunit alpha [Acidobacteriota bacterium]MCB9384148.1 acetyl-CoA carboxylase carboxyltransferase subunit alpha [Bryobacterales bacterium]